MTEAALLSQIDLRREALIRLTQDLVRIPTLNPPGQNYREICDYLAARLLAQGFTVEFVRAEGAPGDSDSYPRWNLVARIEGGSRATACISTATTTWSRSARAGRAIRSAVNLDGDRIYGRGTCDMKGGLAASIIAAEAFIAARPDFRGAIEISATADEESGGYGGVAYLAEQGRFSPDRVQHVIIPEPLNKDRICLGHRGVWWAEIETNGRIAHGSMPFLGDSAIRHMGAVLHEIETVLFRCSPAGARRCRWCRKGRAPRR